MEIEDIKQVKSNLVEVATKEEVEIQENTPIKLILQDENLLMQILDNNSAEMNVLEVVPSDSINEEQIRKILNRNLPRLCSVLNVYEENDMNNITISIKTFSEQIPLDIDFIVKEDSVEKIKRAFSQKKISPVKEFLSELFLININDMSHVVIGVHIHADENDYSRNFLLVGKNVYLHIKREKDDEDRTYFFVDHVQKRIDTKDYNFKLAKGEIDFKTQAQQIREDTLAYMSQLGSSMESYLNTWEKYGNIEKEMIFEKFRKAGFPKYSSREYSHDNKYRIFFESSKKLSSFSDIIEKDDTVTITDINPEFLFREELTLEKYQEYSRENRKQMFTARIVENINPRVPRIVIAVDQSEISKDIPGEGYIMYSLNGDVSRFERRERARQKILNAQSEIPQLASILEGNPISRSRSSQNEPLTDAVKKEIFPEHEPTIRQKEAIKIALNTPDIAIIQGPPGTGKTTVITAIFKRINEISDSTNGIFGRQLISAFQHDAVQNAVERIKIMGLPAVKFGRRSGDDSTGGFQVIESYLEDWIYNILQKLYNNNPGLQKDKYIIEFNNIHKNYLFSSNTIENTIKLLKKTKELVMTRLNSELLERINDKIVELEIKSSGKREIENRRLIKTIYRLPRFKKAYVDGGATNIKIAITALKRREFEEVKREISQLERFESVPPDSTKDFADLAKIRKSLLVKLLPRERIFSTPQQKEDIERLFANISDYLMDGFYRTKSGEDAVIMEYISEFENNPLLVRNSILRYISVLGATNQQVESSVVEKYKKDNRPFDNVLVDEAARSNPLDLFIPMARAKDRIILVGDHRQLPHLVDKKIVSEIKSNLDNDQKDFKDLIEKNIKESMFEHLIGILKKLEKKDGIKRTITLDKQYRTHPVLGDFISKNFYEKHGEIHIGSGLPEELFCHNLPELENKACVWYDVPREEGEEERSQSKYRPVEAEKIASHLKSLLDSDEASGLSFGIITFYSRQRDIILEVLSRVGITEKGEDGNYRIIDKYSHEIVDGRKIEKLRVGTVDAFQGREFDVVYLSMVRSNTLPGETEKQKYRKYGHIMIDNRLCVSMSRQKKMLIVVGDSGMLRNPESEEAVGPLVDYYNLCRGDKTYGKII